MADPPAGTSATLGSGTVRDGGETAGAGAARPDGEGGVGEDRLYDAVGGAAALDVAVTILYDRVVADPAVAPWFDGIDLPSLRQHQRDFLTVVLGGPDALGTAARYRGRELARAHAGLAIDDAAFDRLRDHLLATLEQLGTSPAALAGVGDRIDALRGEVVSA
ncbi:group 1 truncated hemoglobin [Blastococcus sp. TF02A-26]|uniref:group I truncated hemoglobin n=1 Tax=Blastococcus sp. TF02A-26 TaxID=2250577 RepID=UPI000DE8C973|nr:group 1 truncated hemoglobin [Blastococcus sp. TF02A-26]RBY85393.1 group 1 truncated hemoglobin [Blastococcus sp. TF02A-26]